MRCTPGLSPVLLGSFVTSMEFARNPSRWKFTGILTLVLAPADGAPAVPAAGVPGVGTVGEGGGEGCAGERGGAAAQPTEKTMARRNVLGRRTLMRVSVALVTRGLA